MSSAVRLPGGSLGETAGVPGADPGDAGRRSGPTVPTGHVGVEFATGGPFPLHLTRNGATLPPDPREEQGMMSGVGDSAWRPDGRPPTAAQLRKRFGDWLLVEDVAAVEGISAGTWRGYYQKGLAGAPKPDRRRAGRPEWRAATVAAWIGSRQRQPWRPDGRPPTADELAARFGARLLTAAQVCEAEGLTATTWRSYYQAGRMGAPKPDSSEQAARGTSPRWTVEVIAEWAASRPQREKAGTDE